jgi:hypothetical protein
MTHPVRAKGSAMGESIAVVHDDDPSTGWLPSDVRPETTGGPPDTGRTLAAKATYILSETGRKASLLNGGDGRARQQVTIEVPRHRLHLVHVDAQGVARLKLRPHFRITDEQRIVRVEALPEYDRPPSIEELLLVAAKTHELEHAYHAQHAASPRNQRRAVALERRVRVAEAFLADPTRRALSHPPPSPSWCYLMTEQGRMLFDVKRDAGPLCQVPPEAHRRFQADQRERRQRNLELRAQQQALHEGKKAFIAAWIGAQGTPDQKARQAAGLLAIEEAIDAIAEDAFAAARECPRYEHDGATSLQTHLRRFPQYGGAVVTSSDVRTTDTDAEAATSAQWARVLAIRAALPGAAVTLRVHRLSWTRDPQAPSLSLYGVLAVYKVGPLTVRREFAAEDR